MNDDISDGRGRRRPWRFRRAGVLAAAAGFGLLPAGCGGSPSPPVAGPTGLQQALQQAIAYSQCMRSHGITNFPDPTENDGAVQNSNGAVHHGVGIAIPGTIDTSSPRYLSANSSCTKLTGFGHASAGQLQQGLSTLLKYSECMRSHGIANFPDPVENSNGVSIQTAGTGIDVYSPRYKAADKACRALGPGGGS